jgi:hypothetical protein
VQDDVCRANDRAYGWCEHDGDRDEQRQRADAVDARAITDRARLAAPARSRCRARPTTARPRACGIAVEQAPRMKKQLALLGVFVLGCATDDEVDDVELGDTEQAITCPTPPLVTNRSFAVTDPTILAKFSFQRVMNKITATGKSTITSLQLYKDWMASWASCQTGARIRIRSSAR